MQFNRSFFAKAGAAAVALAAIGTAGVAQARSDVYWSVGINAAPGVVVGGSNYPAPVYSAPVYAAPGYVAPAYYGQPPVVYSAPAPVVYSAPPVVYTRPYVYPRPYVAPVVVYRGGGWGHHHHRHDWR
jgi:hypothetical protein